MSVSFIGASGSTVTVLVTDTDGQRVRLTTTFSDRTYASNVDTDQDGIPDAVAADITQNPSPPYGSSYAISRYVAGDRQSVAGVDDYSGYIHQVKFFSNSYNVPSAYLGSQYRDTVNGFFLDWIAGNDGNDILTGGDKDQHLLGGAGNDRIDGVRGDDVIDGGSGRDTLTGGDGADIFVFRPGELDARDVVTDFTQAQHDRVDLSAFEGLRFVDAFTGDGPEVRFRALDDRTALIFDLNGDGVEDARISFTGHIDFAQADLILPG